MNRCEIRLNNICVRALLGIMISYAEGPRVVSWTLWGGGGRKQVAYTNWFKLSYLQIVGNHTNHGFQAVLL